MYRKNRFAIPICACITWKQILDRNHSIDNQLNSIVLYVCFIPTGVKCTQHWNCARRLQYITDYASIYNIICSVLNRYTRYSMWYIFVF